MIRFRDGDELFLQLSGRSKSPYHLGYIVLSNAGIPAQVMRGCLVRMSIREMIEPFLVLVCECSSRNSAARVEHFDAGYLQRIVHVTLLYSEEDVNLRQCGCALDHRRNAF